MQPHFEIVQILMLIINFNFLVIGISLFFTQKGNRAANRYLAFFLFLVTWVNLHYVFHYQKNMFLYFPNLIGTHMPFLFALPPVFYFYFRKVFNPGYRIKPIRLIHFLPMVFVLVYYTPLYFSSAEYKINFIRTGECYINSSIFSVLFFLYFISYLLLVVAFVWKQQRILKGLNADGRLKYTKGILIISFVTISVLIVMVPLRLPFIYSALFTSLLYSYLVYQVFFKPELFFSLQLNTLNTDQKYVLNSLGEEELNYIIRNLETFLKADKAYLNAQLTLPDVASALNISAHHISQAINRKQKLNFNELINRYRVEYARRLMLNPEYRNYTLEAVGNLSGFKTRQTFINAFKKVYNCPPTQYLKYYRVPQISKKVGL